ncbi:MAG TPA: LptF/LptG family permease [Pyrinomonadaceae bacterium]|jgi:LPS export ABC transporter permease LptG/LPS export ABC transporter permease LptF
MRLGGRLIERYIWGAILPYLLLSALLLAAILLAQQATRITELLVSTRVPLGLVLDVVAALLPNVLIFAVPMATLAGTVIGFSRLGSDSELVAMRAAGIGTWKMVWPALFLGTLLTAGTLYLNLQLSPQAARVWKQATLRAAIYKLDSPVEPRSFTTDIPGFVIYVRDGDKEQGVWGRVFLYSQTKDGGTQLVTARSGRIDTAAERSELVLSDAAITTLPPLNVSGEASYVTERLAQVRVQLETGRKALLDRLRREQVEPEEMSLSDLGAYVETQTGAKKREALTLWHKRLTFGLTPLIFSLLGAAVGLRVRKGGRGLGVVLSLLLMVAYYLVALGGEQLARAGTLPAVVGTWLATVSVVGCSLLMFRFNHRPLFIWRRLKVWAGSDNERVLQSEESFNNYKAPQIAAGTSGTRLLSFPSLLDASVLRSLILSFAAALVSLVAIFQIFTLFELWRFIAATSSGAGMVFRYLLFLLPLVLVQLAPASLLIAILASYALMARRSEAVAWWACGQSIYRLMMPGVLFAAAIGGSVWLVQERLMPEANKKQDALRGQIRNGVSRATTSVGRQWLASTETGRLYAYDYEEEDGTLKEPAVYEFDSEGVHLERIIRGQASRWTASNRMEVEMAEWVGLRGAQVNREKTGKLTLEGVGSPEVFKPGLDKPSQLSAKELSAYISKIKSRGGAISPLIVALQRKYAEPFGALVMALIGIPLALSFGRRSAIAALASAVAIGLVFWATTSGFQQLGVYSLLPPAVAAWSPTIIFMAAGTYLLARART